MSTEDKFMFVISAAKPQEGVREALMARYPNGKVTEKEFRDIVEFVNNLNYVDLIEGSDEFPKTGK